MEAAVQSKKATPRSSQKAAFSSPTRITRLAEKEELQNLNDRFAVYIDRIRDLEERNIALSAEITSWKSGESEQVAEVKNLYEGELSNARQLLDEICKEKSRIEVENSRNFNLMHELQEKLDSEQQALKKALDNVLILERKANDCDALLATLRVEHKNLQEKHDKVSTDKDKLQAIVDSTSHQLEGRTLEKVGLENRLQTLTEELDFRKRTYEQELTGIKGKSSSIETSRITMETDFKQKYDSLMKDKLQELREEFEDEADNIKQDVESSYVHKIDDLQRNNEKIKDECKNQIIIIRDLKSSIDTFKIDKSVFENEVTSLKKRIENIELIRANEKDDLTRQLKEKNEENENLNRKIDDLHKEHQELMGIKIALDLEINAYRKLLEGEEERLNITPVVTPSRKRRRTDSETPEQPTLSTAKGNVQISECDPSGQFIRLNNTGSNEEPLGGWMLRRASDGKDPVEFKFSPRSALKGDASVSVWSASSGTKHKPPTDLVMKSCDWGPGVPAVTTLHNSEGDVVAQMTQVGSGELGRTAKPRRKRLGAKNDSCIIS